MVQWEWEGLQFYIHHDRPATLQVRLPQESQNDSDDTSWKGREND